MINSVIMTLFFIIMFHQFLIPLSIANPSGEDNMLIAFIKGYPQIKIIEFTKQKYEAYLGFVYYMRTNWHCDKIANEFEGFERTECQKYRKYLDILHEYLYREHAGIPTVKPKFVFKKEIEIEGPIIYAVNCLARISLFYFKWSKPDYKLNKVFNSYFEPKLLNEKRLKYEIKLGNNPKMSINEMILQLAIDTANEWQTNENLDGIIRENCGEKFDEYLKEMFKKAEEMAKKDNNRSAYNIYYDKHFIIWGSKFDDHATWTDEALFLEFIKGLATKSEKFFRMAKEYSNYLCRMKEKGNIYLYNDEKMISFGLYEIEKMHKHLKQKYEAQLVAVYKMRKNWQCYKIAKEFKEKCQKNHKYLHILHEYLFRLYVEGKNVEFANQFSAVKPIFLDSSEYNQKEFVSIVKTLKDISMFFWSERIKTSYKNYYEMVLKNEDDFIDKGNLFSKFKKQNILKENKIPKNEQKKILDLSIKTEDNLRQEFEHKMEKMNENTKKNAKEEEDKVREAYRKALGEYMDKFVTFNESPFSKSFY